MLTTLNIGLIILGTLMFAALLWIFILDLKLLVVPQEKRLVIYRHGKFVRFAGPGYTLWSKRFATIEREIFVREENKKLAVSGLFINGVPFGYTLELWMRYDPSAALEKGDPRLAELAQFDDRERNEQVKSALRDGLIASLAQVEVEFPPPKGSAFFFKLLPILPGRPEFNKLLEYLQAELIRRLPDVGALFNANRPITILGINLDPQTVAGFNQGRSITLLKEAMPGLPDAQLLNMVAKINGIDIGFQQMQLNGAKGAEMRMNNSDRKPDLKIRIPTDSESDMPFDDEANTSEDMVDAIPSQPSHQQPETLSSKPSPPESPTLAIFHPSKSDWQVLKRLAR